MNKYKEFENNIKNEIKFGFLTYAIFYLFRIFEEITQERVADNVVSTWESASKMGINSGVMQQEEIAQTTNTTNIDSEATRIGITEMFREVRDYIKDMQLAMRKSKE